MLILSIPINAGCNNPSLASTTCSFSVFLLMQAAIIRLWQAISVMYMFYNLVFITDQEKREFWTSFNKLAR
jgi:hypothetical protein